jgi:hypothetical protein
MCSCVAASASAADPAALDALAAALQKARAAAVSTHAAASCPTDLAPLVGLARATLNARLGAADYVMDGRDENPPLPLTTVSYYLRAPGEHGIYPSVTFYVNSSDKVEKVECTISK